MADTTMQEIVDRIKSRRLELKYSYQELADKTGMSKSTLQRYEAGAIRNIPLDKVQVLARGLDVSPEWLMGWQRAASPATPLQLTEQEEQLVISFRGLNDDGREKAVERIDELLDVPKYQNEVCDAYINANRFADKIKREHEKKEDRAPAKYTI
ncbi:MAG: helix-turn-helix domain-containing protein [Firmicutes bacterium]|nr:helix-turn-helix domain-containing protein [Bacillota bacterium]